MTDQSGDAAEAAEGGAILSAVSLAGQGNLDPRAAVVLEKQARVLDLQIANTERHSRLRRLTLHLSALSMVMKVGFEVAIAVIFLAVAGFLTGGIWKAAHDDALVIEAFAVPPDLAARGLDGEVVASRLQDRLSLMVLRANAIHVPHAIRNSWRHDIKVQIPNTGISIGEAYRFLAAWLGSQTFITGELWRDGDHLVFAVRVGDAPAKVFRAPATDLDALIAQAADYVYGQMQR